jgi:hypothetical protein
MRRSGWLIRRVRSMARNCKANRRSRRAFGQIRVVSRRFLPAAAVNPARPSFQILDVATHVGELPFPFGVLHAVFVRHALLGVGEQIDAYPLSV